MQTNYKAKSARQKQLSLIKMHGLFHYNHGGTLRRKRCGRKFRPLSKKDPIHLVLKAHRKLLRENSFRCPRSFLLCQRLIKRYAARFFIRVDQLSIQADHIHLLVRGSDRIFFQAFFRVLTGQIAQRLQKEGLLKLVTDTPKLWVYRPFTRVVKGIKAVKIAKDYIQLNEKEASGVIRYSPQRLVGLSSGEWALLWS